MGLRCAAFHACAAEAVDNILGGGFNRSYAGKNATVYGRGSRVDSRGRGRPGRVVDDAGGVDSRAVGPGVESKRRRPANLPSRARIDVDAGRSVRLARRVSVVHGG